MEISNPGWIPPLSVVASMVADQALVDSKIQPLDRSALYFLSGKFTPSYTGYYIVIAIGGSGSGGGAAGNVAGDSSSAGGVGGAGTWDVARVELTGGQTYNVGIAAAATGGAGGDNTPSVGSIGAAGGGTFLQDAAGNSLVAVDGGFAGLGGQMTSGASLQDQTGQPGRGYGSGGPTAPSSSGTAGTVGGIGFGPGASPGGSSGNNAVATATAGAPGQNGTTGMMLILW